MTAGQRPATPEGGRLVRHFRVLLAADIAVRVLVLGTAVVAARQIGPREFGFATLALAAVSYAGVLGDGGLTTLAQVRLVRSGQRDDQLVATTATLQVALAVLAGVALAGLLWLLPFGHEARLLTLSALPILLAQALSTQYVLQAAERMSAVAGLRLLTQVVASAGCLAGLAVGWSGHAVTASPWVGLLAADGVALVLLLRGRGRRPTLPSRAAVVDYARQAVPYLLAMLSTQAIINADVVVLGLTRSGSEVGQYGVAFRVAGACLSLVGVVMTAVFPELVRRLAAGRGEAAPLIVALVRLTCRPGFAATAVVVLAAPSLMRAVYGSSYDDSARYLAILFPLVPLGFYATILAQSLLAAGHQLAYLRAVGTTAVLTVLALLVTVPAGGATAAAVVAVVGEATTVVTLTLLVREPLGVRALPVLLEQLPFLAAPLGAGALSEWLAGATPWEAAAVAVAVLAGCESLTRHRLLPELRGLLAASRG